MYWYMTNSKIDGMDSQVTPKRETLMQPSLHFDKVLCGGVLQRHGRHEGKAKSLMIGNRLSFLRVRMNLSKLVSTLGLDLEQVASLHPAHTCTESK